MCQAENCAIRACFSASAPNTSCQRRITSRISGRAVDGELYWDGGIYSNTHLQVVLDDYPRVNTLCFMVDLFNPAGLEPTTLAEVLARRKNISYASRAWERL